MTLKTIHGHTIDESLLGDGAIIDVGCRGFEFADYFTGRRVICIDPDPEVFNHPSALIHDCWNRAVSNKAGRAGFHRMGEMTRLIEFGFLADHAVEECVTVTMHDVYLQTGSNIDLLKLDCECGEYMILGDEDFKPIPKMITVEWHRHINPELHDAMIDKVLANLAKYYDHVFASAQDNLFIRR